MSRERTLVLVKPDGVQRGLVGEVIGRLERRGLQLVGLKLMQMDDELAARHYAEHVEKPFYAGLRDFMTSGPLVAAVFAGENAVQAARQSMGADEPAGVGAGLDPGGFRGRYRSQPGAWVGLAGVGRARGGAVLPAGGAAVVGAWGGSLGAGVGGRMSFPVRFLRLRSGRTGCGSNPSERSGQAPRLRLSTGSGEAQDRPASPPNPLSIALSCGRCAVAHLGRWRGGIGRGRGARQKRERRTGRSRLSTGSEEPQEGRGRSAGPPSPQSSPPIGGRGGWECLLFGPSTGTSTMLGGASGQAPLRTAPSAASVGCARESLRTDPPHPPSTSSGQA